MTPGESLQRRARVESARVRGRVGIIDIGSNSIRLVVFDGLSRVPVPLFNERAICALGRGIGQSGRLNGEGIELAIANVYRFARLAEAMQVSSLDLLATAAVRDAADGQAFVQRIEQKTGYPVQVLAGEEEARLSALGVVAGMPDASGFMGDLGGGSLELVELDKGVVGRSATLPLGPLRLIDATGDDRDEARAEIRRHLENVPWIGALKGRGFYAVGGAWRALAKVHMDQAGYPLHVIHGYTLPRDEAGKFAAVIGQQGRRSLARMAGVSRRRIEGLPYAALLLAAVVEAGAPKQVVFSSFGLREGFLYERLPEIEQARDPLFLAAVDFAQREGRFPDLGDDLLRWVQPLFGDEKESMTRLVAACCHLGDIAWREHPDYRALQAMSRLLYHPFIAVEHDERAFLALVAYIRYGGPLDDKAVAAPRALLSDKQQQRARELGLALRLAYALSGGTAALLARSRLQLADSRLTLLLPADGSLPPGETVERRLKALADAVGAKESGISLSKRL